LKTENQRTLMSTQFTVTFVNQPTTSSQVALVPIIGQSIVAAGTWLNSFVKGTGVIDVRVNFDAVIPTMSGASLASETISTGKLINGKPYTIIQYGVATEWMTGRDINGNNSDCIINIGTTNLERYYWFDFSLASSNDIPSNKTDGYLPMMHELIHSMGINGLLSLGSTGSIASVYDQFYTSSDGRNFFTGPNAQEAFGGPVPVTGPHLGDTTSFANKILLGSETVMSYSYIPNGLRLSLDPVLIGVLRDLGYTVRDTQASFKGVTSLVNTAKVGTSSEGFQIAKTLDLDWLTFTNRAEYSYLLTNVQRLEFTDKKVAIDISGNAGTTAKILGAVFGKDSLTNKQYVGIGLSLLDAGMSTNTLSSLAVDAANLKTNDQIVSTLWKNVFGTTATSADKAPYVKLLDDGMSAGTLAWLAADTSFNTTNINLVGLAQTGIEYIPVT